MLTTKPLPMGYFIALPADRATIRTQALAALVDIRDALNSDGNLEALCWQLSRLLDDVQAAKLYADTNGTGHKSSKTN